MKAILLLLLFICFCTGENLSRNLSTEYENNKIKRKPLLNRKDTGRWNKENYWRLSARWPKLLRSFERPTLYFFWLLSVIFWPLWNIFFRVIFVFWINILITETFCWVELFTLEMINTDIFKYSSLNQKFN